MVAQSSLTDTAAETAAAVAELSRRTAMLSAVGDAATRFIGAENWRSEIPEFLYRLAIATSVSRSYIFQAHPGPDGRLVQSLRFDWAEPGLQALTGDPRYTNMRLTDDDGGMLGEWSLRRMRGEVVQATLREVSGYTRQVFKEHGTLALLSVPITLTGGEWWGHLGFDDCRVERVWTRPEIDVLRTAAALIAGAVERERAEERLRLSEERYALAARGSNDGLWDWDLISGKAYFSPRLHQILGRREGELAPEIEAFYDLLHPDDAEALREQLRRRASRLRLKIQAECRTTRPDGRLLWLIVRGLIVYSDRRPVRMVGSVRDITDRKLAEERLRRSEVRLRNILDTAGDAIVSAGADGRIAEFNRAAERLFGYGHDEVLGEPMAPLLVPPHLRELHLTGMSRYLATGKSKLIGRLIEIDAMRADGGIVPVELTLSEVRTEGEHLFTAFLRDITERRRFQEQIKEAERKRDNLARYFSPKVVDRLMGQEGPLSSVKLPHVTVLFADMMGFGAISRFAPAEETLRLLREFHALIEQAVFDHEGSLDKYMGDGLMATFGTPEPGPRDASNAVACARAMAASVVAWSCRRRDLGLPAIQIGIGLHCGEVTLGDIGSERHPEFTVVGDTVNLASRIEELTREHEIGILASEDVVRAVRAEGGEAVLEGFRDLGPWEIRGRDETVRLWGRTADDLASADRRTGAPSD